jgi:hypothetical protein
MRRYRAPIFTVLSLAVVAGVVFALGLIFGAWDVGSGSDGGSSGPGSSTEVTRERDGVRMKLSVDKETYGPDDPVVVTLEIENTNDTAVEYRGKTANEAGLTLIVTSDLANPQPLVEPSADDLSGTLAGGARIQRRVEWDKVIDMSLTPVTAPPGTYSVGAAFLMARAGFADLLDLGAAVSFKVEGTGYVQPPLDALRAMIAATRRPGEGTVFHSVATRRMGTSITARSRRGRGPKPSTFSTSSSWKTGAPSAVSQLTGTPGALSSSRPTETSPTA